MKSEKKSADLHLAFDVGHSSIGWSVIRSTSVEDTNLLGCGAVVFQADDCLASERRAFRRQRRHVRATRLRIARLRRLLAHLGVLTKAQLEVPGCAWPWLLAARVLRGGETLSWPELWDVLRWYAHNRGYDGNRGWSRHEIASDEDSEKEKRAGELLVAFAAKHGREGTMAEVFCDVLGLDPLGAKKSSTTRMRNLNAAFPREGVEAEVERILRAHIGRLPAVEERLLEAILRDHTAVTGADLRLPARYGQRLADGSLSAGGVLFGQLVPRFDNRIIASDPIRFEHVYREMLEETGDADRARHEAEKRAKVPSVACVEFHRYRWVMQLANVKVATDDPKTPRGLNVAERQAVHAEMEAKGFFTPGEFKKAVRRQIGSALDNLDQLLTHPDAERALVLDPVKRFVRTNAVVVAVWPLLAEPVRKRLIGQWRRGRIGTIGGLLDAAGGEREAVAGVLDRQFDAVNSRRRRKDAPITREAFFRQPLGVPPPNGRAPFTRETMREVFAFVLDTDRHPAEEGGPIYRSAEIREAQLKRSLDEQTNNHLVRHRLKILERLHDDLVKEYAGGARGRIARITIEVNRDLREMSGKTAQEQAKVLNQQLFNFKQVAKKLEEAYEGRGVHVGPGLIRKGRIAEDLGWRCPYTGLDFDPLTLLHNGGERGVDKDHIIPRAERASDSLDSLVITFNAVNRFKGKRTAYRFVEAEQCREVPGMPGVFIKSLSSYERDVEALKPLRDPRKDRYFREKRVPIDDALRCWNRKRLLLLPDYVEKEFKPGDLTQTSQLVRLGAQLLQRHYLGEETPPVVTSLPGSVTGAVRKSWNLLGTLAVANPLVLAEDESGGAKVRSKTEIRGITHLHHALDASVLNFAALFLPRDGGAWELLVKRRLNEEEARRARQIFGAQVEITLGRELRLGDLPAKFKEQICSALKERRVAQHLPRDLSGLRAKETVWRVFDPSDPHPNSQRFAGWLARQNILVPSPEAATAIIICRKRRSAEAAGVESVGGKILHETKTWRWVYDVKDKSALLGLEPQGDNALAKLKRIKAVKVLGENFGLALDPELTLIRPHKVWHQLERLRAANGGKPVRVLRRGMLIRLPVKGIRPQYEGVWMVRGVTLNQRAGFLVDLSPPDQIIYRRQSGSRENVSVATLLKCGLEIVRTSLCGVAAVSEKE